MTLTRPAHLAKTIIIMRLAYWADKLTYLKNQDHPNTYPDIIKGYDQCDWLLDQLNEFYGGKI